MVSLKAALQVLEIKEFDLVLLDLSLPDSHGYETVTEFAKAADVPFIVLTGNDDMAMAMRTTRLGAQDYLLKTEVQAKPLERALCVAVGKAGSEREKRRRSYETLNQLIPPEQATVALLQPRISHLMEAVEDLEGYIRINAPNLLEDVLALLDKHKVQETIKEARDILRMKSDQERSTKRRRISDAAMRVLDSVSEKRPVGARPSEPPKDWEAAEAIFNDLAAKGDGS